MILRVYLYSDVNQNVHLVPGIFSVCSATVKAGPGGGAETDSSTSTKHGKSFKDTLQYAVGGNDPVQGGNTAVLSANTHGGFGAGGGGGASGGGGGGYRGGDTRNDNSVHYPGSGGSSHYLSSVSLLEWNYQNGFVRVQHEKCGCAHNCTVDSNRSVFWCTCPENTTLSPDGYDCHRGTYVCCVHPDMHTYVLLDVCSSTSRSCRYRHR